MPFDSRPQVSPKLAKMDRVIELLATEDKWCKGEYENSIGQHCIVGAMAAAQMTLPRDSDVFNAVRHVIEIEEKVPRAISLFNDHPSTTHADVLRVLHRARQIIVEEEGR